MSKGGVRLDRLNLHTLTKKGMRLNQKLFHSSRPQEERDDYRAFHEQEERVRSMEQVRILTRACSLRVDICAKQHISEPNCQAAKKLVKRAQEYTSEIVKLYEFFEQLALHIKVRKIVDCPTRAYKTHS